MKYMKRTNVFKASNLELNAETLESWSYRWYVLSKHFGKYLVLNDYSYSPSTVKHVYKVRRKFDELGKEYVTIEAPNGLQDLDSAVSYYETKIQNLNDLINKKGTRKSTNLERMNQIKQYEKKIELIQNLKISEAKN